MSLVICGNSYLKQ